MDTSSFIASLRERYLELSPHMSECGLEIAHLSTDSATLVLPSREDWLGDAESGRFNPGVITMLVDNTAGLAVIARAGRREPIATLDLRMDYLRPAFIGTPVSCRAQCIRMTRSIAFAHAVIWQDDEHTPIATAQGVFMRSGARQQQAAGA